ncbi:MAG: hypothetical protein RLZZ540_329 [Bacteroidota bacterium]|jgi:polysaccharide export outer membrane protein
MKYFFILKKTIPLVFVLFLFSCTPRKDIVYYQNIDTLSSKEKINSYEIKIQPDDLLSINVTAEDPQAVIPFGGNSDSLGSVASSPSTVGASYLVDDEGFINFPVLGKLKVSGLTRSELLKLFENKIAPYVKNPIIIIRIINFKISVQGEVNATGVFPVKSERVTLIEALSMAGDLTIKGRRDNILIIREIDGVKSYFRVDITKADFINSPFYYLAQNDVVYVEPIKNKINEANTNPNTTLYLSAVSMFVTLFTLAITILK